MTPSLRGSPIIQAGALEAVILLVERVKKREVLQVTGEMCHQEVLDTIMITFNA